jgi:hypothetical protein
MLNDVDERAMTAKQNISDAPNLRNFLISLVIVVAVTVFMLLGYDLHLQSLIEECVEDPSTPGIELIMSDEYGFPFCMRDWRG